MNNLIASIVMLNMLEKHIKNDEKISEIEKAVITSINETGNVAKSCLLEATEDNVIFSFSWDPSVTTETIPVMVYITVFKPSSSASTLGETMQKKLKEVLPGRKVFINFMPSSWLTEDLS